MSDWRRSRVRTACCVASTAALINGCGGGESGNDRDSGTEKTSLSVAASDRDGDGLSYQWRVTAGTVENRNSRETVWTLPDGRGLHFAYVLVSDGRGGYAEQQYGVATDNLETSDPDHRPVSYPITTTVPAFDGTAIRLRISQAGSLNFGSPDSPDPDNGELRTVYLPGVQVTLTNATTGAVVFSGTTDLSGELNLPQLQIGPTYSAQCTRPTSTTAIACGSFSVSGDASSVISIALGSVASDNLRLHGHISLADGGTCGTQSQYFGVASSATVQLLDTNAQALTAPIPVNRYGDYVVNAPVPLNNTTIVRIVCGADSWDQAIAPATDSDLRNRLTNSLPIEISRRSDNRSPTISKMVAAGPEGNVRGRMVVEETGAISNGMPGDVRFLSYKGTDSALSACMYYRAIGAVSGCDAQGRLQGAISLSDWKARHGITDNNSGPDEVAATYINERDLNLVRRMAANRGPNGLAFVVCNNPGPEGRSQAEVNEVIEFGTAGKRRVACVAMEWSTTKGVNGGAPFTKFLTFGPEGSLIPSVNLDGRGEKFMPGACVACHGGSRIGGRFPESGNPSPLLGARFLPFDTGNFRFSTHSSLSERDQSEALRKLNEYVVETEGTPPPGGTPTTRLFTQWYGTDDRNTKIDHATVPTAWQSASDDKKDFYRSVIARSCRTCHVALDGSTSTVRFDWDSRPERFPDLASGQPRDPVVHPHACGGTADLATNASMPNALASLNRLLDPDASSTKDVTALMERFIGCRSPQGDPVYPRR